MSMELLTAEERIAQQKQEYWIAILNQLTQSPRFLEFVRLNYTFKDDIDDVAKTITTLVIENPVCRGPELNSKQKMDIQSTLKLVSEGKSWIDGFSTVLKILGEESSLIISDSKDRKIFNS